jgi:hypothetical protein
MKLRNILLIGGGGLLAIVIGAVIWLASSLDSIVKSAIETYGPDILGVSVKVGSVSLSPTSGQGTIKGLRIGNPSGYKTSHALTLSEISITVDPASLTGDVVHIKDVLVSGTDVSYEKVGNTTNLDTIQHNVDAYMRKHGGGGKPASGEPQKKMIIDNLVIQGTKAEVTGGLTAGKTVSASIPDVRLRDIGKRNNGATAGEVTHQIISALTASVTRAATAALGDMAKGAGKAADSVRGFFR